MCIYAYTWIYIHWHDKDFNFSALTRVGSKFIQNVSNTFVNDSATVLLTVLVGHVGMLFENAHAQAKGFNWFRGKPVNHVTFFKHLKITRIKGARNFKRLFLAVYTHSEEHNFAKNPGFFLNPLSDPGKIRNASYSQ